MSKAESCEEPKLAACKVDSAAMRSVASALIWPDVICANCLVVKPSSWLVSSALIWSVVKLATETGAMAANWLASNTAKSAVSMA